MQKYRYPASAAASFLAARATDAAATNAAATNAVATNAAAPGATQRKKTEAEKFAERLARLVQRRTDGTIRQLRVEIKPEGIYLDGRCATFYRKQLAQEAVLAITEDQKLFNQIEVC